MLSSQSAPAPSTVPFRFISRTIGQGAYAYIRKAVPVGKSSPVFAVKIIDHDHAFNRGKLSPHQLKTELSLHKYLGRHQNIIQCLQFAQEPTFTWLAMELADGGDLFDKIEADSGVSEDIAHFYFSQLISAVAYMHSKGVGHRDIKPENMLLSASGDLKLADFGLAALFEKGGQVRMCKSVCGSPPYIAPEIVGKLQLPSTAEPSQVQGQEEPVLQTGYMPNISDIWSCGVVLFVLLAGNTPWDEPTGNSAEFIEYVETNGRTTDELWLNLPEEVKSLLRGMLKLEPSERFTLESVRKHPWFSRPNPHLSKSGTAANPISLATAMLESLHIDLSRDRQHDSLPPRPPRQPANNPDAMDVDDTTTTTSSPMTAIDVALASTQPETVLTSVPSDWERPPPRTLPNALDPIISASQPVFARRSSASTHFPHQHRIDNDNDDDNDEHTRAMLADDPTMSQFTPTPSVPLSLTQHARRFADIVPAHSLTRFLSAVPPELLLTRLADALHSLGVPGVSFMREGGGDGGVSSSSTSTSTLSHHQPNHQNNGGATGGTATHWCRVRAVGARKEQLKGTVVVERYARKLLEVRFVKSKGDPLEWRRFFKRVVAGVRDCVYVPEG